MKESEAEGKLTLNIVENSTFHPPPYDRPDAQPTEKKMQNWHNIKTFAAEVHPHPPPNTLFYADGKRKEKLKCIFSQAKRELCHMQMQMLFFGKSHFPTAANVIVILRLSNLLTTPNRHPSRKHTAAFTYASIHQVHKTTTTIIMPEELSSLKAHPASGFCLKCAVVGEEIVYWGFILRVDFRGHDGLG